MTFTSFLKMSLNNIKFPLPSLLCLANLHKEPRKAEYLTCPFFSIHLPEKEVKKTSFSLQGRIAGTKRRAMGPSPENSEPVLASPNLCQRFPGARVAIVHSFSPPTMANISAVPTGDESRSPCREASLPLGASWWCLP